MLSMPEARAAVLACRKYKKPVWVTVAPDEGGMLLSGGQALACLVTLQWLGVDAFGFNCGAGVDGMVTALRTVSPYASVPLIAKPGVPVHSPLSPEAFAGAAEQLLNAGASIIGGCCGTPFSALPVCFQSEDPEALSRALFLYNGRAMVDSNTTMEESGLKKIADRYGAFVY